MGFTRGLSGFTKGGVQTVRFAKKKNLLAFYYIVPVDKLIFRPNDHSL